MIQVEVTNEQDATPIDEARLQIAVEKILADAGVANAEISIAAVDDPTIHELNRRHLNHDYATDVLSFLLERDGASLDGEIVVSGDTAASNAVDYGWSAEEELLLYVIHGALHLVGYDDKTPEGREQMRTEERRWLLEMGVTPNTALSPAERTSK
jgi:probable rRNA maturation factor